MTSQKGNNNASDAISIYLASICVILVMECLECLSHFSCISMISPLYLIKWYSPDENLF